MKKIILAIALMGFIVGAKAQLNTSTITIDGAASEPAYATSGNYSVAWDNTYLYIGTSNGGTSYIGQCTIDNSY